MDAAANNPLEQILSRRSLVRGRVRMSIFWSILAVLMLLFLLLDLCLLLGLCTERGRVDLQLSPAEASRFERLSGLGVSLPVPTEPSGQPDAEIAPAPVHVYFDEHGILPDVWLSRDVWWGGSVAFLFRHVMWLQSNILALIWLLCVGALLFIIRNFSLAWVRDLCHQSAIDAVNATRRNLHRQVLRLGPEDLDGTGYEVAGQLFTVEVDIIRESLYETLSRTIRYPLELIVLAIVMLSLDWRLALQWIAPATLVIFLVESVRVAALKKQRLAEDRSRDDLNFLLASLKNARLTRGLGLEEREHEQFQKHLNRYHAQLTSTARMADVAKHPQARTVIFCISLLAFLLFLVGGNVLVVGKPASYDRLTVAEAITFVVAAFLSVPGIRALRSLPEFRHDLTLSADKVYRYLKQIPTVSQAVGAKFLQPMGKTLHFDHVKYHTSDGKTILDGVDFKIEVDKNVAIVSLNPLEARAVALMLPRFIEPRQGRILIDGEDIAWVTLESLRAETALVAACDPPMDGTVLDNIRGGYNDLTLQQATEAAKLAHAHNFIVKLFNGYETVLTSHGNSLDIGQQFRLNLARAIARNPALLIIEEPAEAIDEDTKTLLVDAYDRICRDRTVVFLPSRMSTIRRTDQIIVLHEGKVVAMGPHAKLVTQSPIYRHWEYLRFNEFRHESPPDKN